MILRAYKSSDAPVIVSWITSEEEHYKWSATIYNKYPITGDDVDTNYSKQLEAGRFFPLMAIEDKPVGHFFIKYPVPEDDTYARIGLVVVDPSSRGKHYGREMLRLGLEYAKNELHVSRVSLGVFDNNPNARRCYESLGFKEFGDGHVCEMPVGTWHCTDMEIFI